MPHDGVRHDYGGISRAPRRLCGMLEGDDARAIFGAEALHGKLKFFRGVEIFKGQQGRVKGPQFAGSDGAHTYVCKKAGDF